jgi:hypothetical protein
MGKDNYLHGKCPVEVYGVEVAIEVVPKLYAGQQDCSCTHGCVREECLLDGSWTDASNAAADPGESVDRRAAPQDLDQDTLPRPDLG